MKQMQEILYWRWER